MKPKKLKKKIQQLEKRLREGSEKLARLKRKLQQAESAKALKAARKSAARATASAGKKSGIQQQTRKNQAVPETQEETESLTGASCSTCCRDESQMGCEEGRRGK